MEKIINITFIFFFVFSVCAQSDCPIIPYPRRTYIGFINAQINNDPYLHGKINQYQYPLAQQLIQSGINVAIGVVGLQFTSNSQIQFNIQNAQTGSLTSLKFKVRLISQINGWRLLRFSFIASQSPLFQINTQTTNQFSIGVDTGKYVVYRPIPNYAKIQTDPVIKIFLSGIAVKAKPLDDQFRSMVDQYETFKKFSTNGVLVKYFSQAIQSKKSLQVKLSQTKIIGRLYTFMIQTNTQLTSIGFSYIIFNKKSVTQNHNFISDSASFINNDQYKFSSLQNMDMLLTGLSGFTIPRQNLYSFSLGINNLGGQSYYNLNTNYKYLQIFISYIAFQLKSAYVCQQCTNSPIIYDNKFCVQDCPRGYSVSQNLGIKFCDKCDIDKLKVIDPLTNLCVCAKKHFLDNVMNTCLPCRYDCMSCDRTNRCLTCDNSLMQTKRILNIDGSCQCPSFGYYDDKNNQDIVCQKCNNKCLTCNGPYAHNCLTCQSTKQRDSRGFCICKNGFIEDFYGNCICPNPKTLTQNGLCIDQTIYSCGPDKIQQYIDLTRRCICKPGLIPILDQCIQCKNNSKFNQITLKCQCAKPTIQVNGQCKACDINQNQIYDQINKICVCKDGSYQSKNGTCVVCPTKMVLINQRCQCAFNYYEDSFGVCRRCQRQTDGAKCKRNLY